MRPRRFTADDAVDLREDDHGQADPFARRSREWGGVGDVREARRVHARPTKTLGVRLNFETKVRRAILHLRTYAR